MLSLFAVHPKIPKLPLVKITSLLFFTYQALTCLSLSGAEVPPESAPRLDTPKQLDDLRSLQDGLRKVLPDCRAATVVLEANDGSGSGVVVSPDGLILTAAHVAFKPGRKFNVILADGRKVKAESLGMSEISDAGMVRLLEKGTYAFAPVEKSRSSQAGEWCFALGHPGGLDESRGVVLRIGRVISLAGATVRSDCDLLPGDSGGPLFSLDGRVIAIHSSIRSDRLDNNYHVDIKAFVRNWDRFVGKEVIPATGSVSQGFLGVRTAERPDGVSVVEFDGEGPAGKAGLRLGDIVLAIGGEVVTDQESFSLAVRSHAPGEDITLKVRRLEKILELKTTLGSRGPNPK